MVTSLVATGTPALQGPALQLPVPPPQVSAVPGFFIMGSGLGGPKRLNPPPDWNPELPLDTLLPASGKLPFWSDKSFPSLGPLLGWNFLVAAKPAVTKRATQRVTASDVRFTVFLLSGSGRNL